MTWQIPFGFYPQHFEMLLDIEGVLWESSVFSDGYTEEIEQAHQHIKDAIAILKESVEVTA